MSKSNAVEIIAILYLIAGLLVHNWFHWVLFVLAMENTIESMFYSWLDHKHPEISKVATNDSNN